MLDPRRPRRDARQTGLASFPSPWHKLSPLEITGMRTTGRYIAAALAVCWGAGCQMSASLLPPEGPPPAVRAACDDDQNPVYLPLGPCSYGPVFEAILQTLHDYGFEIAESNRYDGRIETLPRI